MPQLHHRMFTAGAGFAAVALATVTLAGPAAAAPATVTTNPVKAAAGWLTTQFVGAAHLPTPSGNHFDSKFGSAFYPSYGENADVIFGLAAGKVGGAKIATALSYLAGNVDAYADTSKSQGGPYDGSVAKLAVAAIVAGANPRSFGGVDLLATLASDECPAGSTTCTPGSAANIFSSISESFVILAEARGPGSAPSANALKYLTSLQCKTAGAVLSGFTSGTSACGTGAPDIDATSYALMALDAVGGHGPERAGAITYLKSQQKPGGYWVGQGQPNANSTGLAAAALQSQGVDVSSARSWLLSQQVGRGKAGAGAIKYAGSVTPTTTSATSPSVLATAQALTGLVNGGSLSTLSAAGTQSAPALFAASAKASPSTVRTGAKQSATGTGFAAGEKIRVSLGMVTLATVTADGLGVASSTYTVPASATGGSREIVLTGLSSRLTAGAAVTVVAPSSTSASSGSNTATSPPVAGNMAGPSTSVLAATGQDRETLLALTAAGLLALAAGSGLVAGARRRQH